MVSRPRHIVFIAASYPSRAYPSSGVFVEQLVKAIARTGTKCTVVHPLPVHEWARDRLAREKGTARAEDGSMIEVVRPLYVSLSDRRLGPLRTIHATQWLFQRAATRGVRRLAPPPDAVYGHFLYSAGAAAALVGEMLNVPSIVAVGEGVFWTVEPFGVDRARRDLRPVRGFIAVSSRLKRKLVEDIGIPAEKITTLPNGVDLSEFFPRDRVLMRKKYGLPLDQFLVVYVGNFIATKGVQRVVEAIAGLEGTGGVFVGSGPIKPSGSNVVFVGSQPHRRVPEILAAADAFVLPTDIEGSCNGIIEAMACGLPVITSEGDFNDDLVDETMSIRVDPRDVGAIRAAIVTLQQNQQIREELAAAALERSRQFDINRRAEKVLSWIARCM